MMGRVSDGRVEKVRPGDARAGIVEIERLIFPWAVLVV